MRLFSVALVATVCVGLGGCLGDDDESAPSIDARSGTAACPDGEQPRSGVFDLGENPGGAPSPRRAVARFLRLQNSELTAGSFVRVDPKSSSAPRARFTHSDDGFQLVQLYIERLEGGWLVIAYDFCRGAL